MYKYSLEAFGQMIVDSPRMVAYAEALRQVINENSVVVDIGAGTGIFSLLAAQFGARRVFAIEPSEVLGLAVELAQFNQLADRIEFYETLSTKAELPEPANVIVSDLRGVLPLYESNIPSLVDARRRFLVPGGVMIPREDHLRAALVSLPEKYANLYDRPWITNDYQVNMRPIRDLLVNNWRQVHLTPEALVGEVQTLGIIDYPTVVEPNFQATITWTTSYNASVHGVSVWFDTVLLDSIGFSNSPLSERLVYGQGFFPFPQPTELSINDTVSFQLHAAHIAGDYVWRWNTTITDELDRNKSAYRQSSFLAAPISKRLLRTREASAVPRLSDVGKMKQFVLSQINSHSSMGMLAEQLIANFPTHFSRRQEAIEFIAQLVEDVNS